jgi:threonine/homoserine/homoserine lactone efflux protein
MSGLATIATVMAVFVPALLLPGPDFVGVLRAATAGGRRAGLLAALGVAIGLASYATLGLLGLSAILVRFEWLAWAVRVAGGAYLIWLGIGLLRAPAPTAEAGPEPARPTRGGLLFGLSVTLTNPKAIVLFASLFATSVDALTPLWVLSVLIALVGLLALAWYALVACLLASGPAQRRLARARRAVDRVAGGCFLLFGGKVLADARGPLAP